MGFRAQDLGLAAEGMHSVADLTFRRYQKKQKASTEPVLVRKKLLTRP